MTDSTVAFEGEEGRQRALEGPGGGERGSEKKKRRGLATAGGDVEWW